MLSEIRSFLMSTQITFGGVSLSLWDFLLAVVLIAFLVYASGVLKRWIMGQLLKRSHLDASAKQAIGTIVRYLVVTIGFIVILESAGINLSSLTVLAGALGVGIGFGLQNITNNFVSGMVILLERPIKVGDRVEVGSTVGDVTRISARATTVVTNENISVIVPNSEFITSKVINWSHSDRNVRINVPVGVSYSSNPDQIRTLLVEVAREHPGVLNSPSADVIFQEFGDSSLNFVLRVWTSDYINKPQVLRSDLNFAIFRKFAENGVVIPFPQRDLHIKSGTMLK